MADNDFINQGTQISGADISIQPGASAGTRFLSSFMKGITSSSDSEAKMKKEKSKLTYYTELRNAGYSAEEATARVNKQFSGTFLDRALGRDSAGFEKPAQDTFLSKTAEDKSIIKKNDAVADYYNRSKGKGTYPNNTKDGEPASVQTARSEQISNAIYSTQQAINNEKDPAKKKVLESKLEKYEKALDKFMLGPDSESSSTGIEIGEYVAGKTKPGQPFMYNGKKLMIDPNDPGDPEDPNVIPA